MAGIVRQTCPYCKTLSVACEAVYNWRTGEGGKRALVKCGACGEAIIREYVSPHDFMQVSGDVSRHSFILGKQWPEEACGAAPKDTPENTARFFEQATSSLASNSFDAAGMMFRKTLESATKILCPDSADKPLVKRIASLASKGKLTPDLAQWAHEVRLGGNEAAHEDEPFSESDAQDLKNFVENFLRYAFTLPSAVKRREGRLQTEAV